MKNIGYKTILLLIVAVLLFATSALAQSTTEKIDSTALGFSVTAPVKMDVTTKEGTSEKGVGYTNVTYAGETKSGNYFIGVTTPHEADATIDIDGAIKGAMAAVNATITSQTSFTRSGVPAIGVTFTFTSEGVACKGAAMVTAKGHRLYQVLWITEASNTSTSDEPKVFFSSFELK